MMRLLVLAFAGALLAAPAAGAATCNDLEGRTVQCGTLGALPVGWKPSPDILTAQQDREPRPAGLSETQIFGIVCFIGGLLALFAVLPDFEDGKGGGWDRQEDDEA